MTTVGGGRCGDTEMNEDMWEITEMPYGTWFVQKEGTRRAAYEVLICEGLTEEHAMAIAAASGRVLVREGGQFQRWGIPK